MLMLSQLVFKYVGATRHCLVLVMETKVVDEYILS